MTTLRAQQLAISEIEQAFEDAGWSDGNIMSAAQVRSATNPLYYKNATPEAAAEATVVVDGVGRKIYCIYTLLKPRVSNSANKCHHVEITIALAIYFDDPYTLSENSKHYPFIDALMNELAVDDWIISSDGDDVITNQSEHSPYMYRKTIYATNVF